MKTRIKKTAGTAVTRDQAEALVGSLRELAIEEQELLAEKNEQLKSIEEEYSQDLSRIAMQRKLLLPQIEAWAEANPAEFGQRKSLEFTHGTIGFRTGMPKLVMIKRIPGGWKGALDLVMKFLPAFIRNAPEIDKEALIGQRDDPDLVAGLKLCGLKVDQSESFFVEPKLDQVEERQTSEVAHA